MPLQGLDYTELGVVAIVLLLVLERVLKFLKDIVIPKLTGSGNSRDAEDMRRQIQMEETIKQIALTMDRQTSILSSMEFILADLKNNTHTLVKAFREHELATFRETQNKH